MSAAEKGERPMDYPLRYVLPRTAVLFFHSKNRLRLPRSG